MIAIFFALSQEVASLKPQVNILKKTRYGHALIYQTEFYGFPVMVVQTGVGKKVSDVIHHLSKQVRIQLMISSGFAGSVNPDVRVGDLVIGKDVLSASQNAFEGEIRIDSRLTCDAPVADIAVKLQHADDYHVHYGDILTVNKIIRKSSTKKHIGSCTSAIAVDMESFIIAERAHADFR